MTLWTFTIFSALLGAKLLFEDSAVLSRVFEIRREQQTLRRVVDLLHELQETFEAGLLPGAEKWEALQTLPPPWGKLSHESLQELRKQGGAILPTLRRLRSLAEDYQRSLSEAKAKASQALAQALVCAGLVPVFGAALYTLLPGMEQVRIVWGLACLIAVLISGLGALWLLAMAEEARWAGLVGHQREWILLSQCAGERFLALVRAGTPSDLAWTRVAERLAQDAPELALHWGSSLWTEIQGFSGREAARKIIQAGGSLRKSIQISLMEGRPCTERVESALAALRQDLKTQIEKELSLLGTRALKPLFLCVAPSMIALLGFGLFLGWGAGT